MFVLMPTHLEVILDENLAGSALVICFFFFFSKQTSVLGQCKMGLRKQKQGELTPACK